MFYVNDFGTTATAVAVNFRSLLKLFMWYLLCRHLGSGLQEKLG